MSFGSAGRRGSLNLDDHRPSSREDRAPLNLPYRRRSQRTGRSIKRPLQSQTQVLLDDRRAISKGNGFTLSWSLPVQGRCQRGRCPAWCSGVDRTSRRSARVPRTSPDMPAALCGRSGVSAASTQHAAEDPMAIEEIAEAVSHRHLGNFPHSLEVANPCYETGLPDLEVAKCTPCVDFTAMPRHLQQ